MLRYPGIRNSRKPSPPPRMKEQGGKQCSSDLAQGTLKLEDTATATNSSKQRENKRNKYPQRFSLFFLPSSVLPLAKPYEKPEGKKDSRWHRLSRSASWGRERGKENEFAGKWRVTRKAIFPDLGASISTEAERNKEVK